MVRQTRREFVSLVVAGAASSLGVGGSLQTADAPLEFPGPTLIDPNSSEWTRKRSDMIDGKHLELDPAAGETFVERVWNPRAQTTEAVNEIASTADLDERETVPGTISLLYREGADGELEYLFDFGVSEAHWHDVWDGPPGSVQEKFERTFDEHGVQITCHLESGIEADMSVEVPYSMYATKQSHAGLELRSILPAAGANGFDPGRHAPLVEAIEGVFEHYEAESGESVSAYGEVAAVSELIQSIPHETDWVSDRGLSFVRTPEATLVELTADCKDASLLMYHLFESFGYSPVFVYLMGDPIEPMRASTGVNKSKDGDDEKSADDKVQYPNHLAVGLPLEEIEPIPEPLADDVTPLESDGTEYAYIESTEYQPPGVGIGDRFEMDPILYNDRREFAGAFLPFL